MFTRRKLLLFGLIAMIFLVFVIWIFSTISKTFNDISRTSQTEHIVTLAESVPSDPDDFHSWKERIESQDSGMKILYLSGDPLDTPVLETSSPQEQKLFAELEASSDFDQAIESVSYQEKFFSKNSYDVDGMIISPVYVPLVVNDYDIAGTVIILSSDSSAKSFNTLLFFLALIMSFAVLAAVWIVVFSREPIVGYAIIILFTIVGVFVVYPLYEAFKLSVMAEGRISLDVWKLILSQSKIWIALKNSVILGISTATMATVVGYIFAFYTTRTVLSPRMKRFIKALANLPVISPPFSLTLAL
ncbi:MAG: hypothetical protein RBT73_11930, partial [Spirochaetia bacterium]|nr:hypothetical protein [Spirochaetia bacterium]